MDDGVAQAKQYLAKLDVSRETFDALCEFDALFLDWAQRLNLVARSTLPMRWNRHFLDSLQLFPLVPQSARTLVDIGSGAGFPGIPVAILAKNNPALRDSRFYLIDSVGKKCAFLREVKSRLDLNNVMILNKRIEAAKFPDKVDVVSARALADLTQLLGYAQPFLHNRSVCLFMKGKSANAELTAAAAHWKMKAIPHPSLTDDEATILEIRNVKRA